MRTQKRFLSLFMSLCLVVSLFSPVVFADEGQAFEWNTTYVGALEGNSSAPENRVVSATFDNANREFAVSSTSGRIHASEDSYQFAYLPISDIKDKDFKFSAQISSFISENGDLGGNHWALLMARTGTAANSDYISIGLNNSQHLLREFRALGDSKGASTYKIDDADASLATPIYVMLERDGDVLTTSLSEDGVDYIKLNSYDAEKFSLALNTDVLNVGFALSRSSATFDHVVFEVDGVEIFNSETNHISDFKAVAAVPEPENPGDGDGEEPDEGGEVDDEFVCVYPTEPNFITQSPSSEWCASAFGDLGTNDINNSNFEISELGTDKVKLAAGVSSNRGKISADSEGMVYYFQKIEPDDNFELTAKAHVNSFSGHNQDSFGLMLRSNAMMNQRYPIEGNSALFTGNYIAVGALDQEMKGFIKSGFKDYLGERGTQNKNDFKFATSANAPAADQEYTLSISKSGNTYTLKINDEMQVIEDFNEDMHFAGLYTARYTTVTFSDINLDIERPVEVDDDWSFRAFGGNTSTNKNPDPTSNEDGSISIITNNGGKIASGDIGISFYYKEISHFANFELKAKATVDRFPGDNNQQSFGLMLLDQVGDDRPEESVNHTADYIALGALDSVNDNEALRGMKPFYKKSSQTKLPVYAGKGIPKAGDEYDLSIRKSGNTYVFSIDGVAQSATVTNIFTETIFAGLYAAREADITYSDFELIVDYRKVINIDIIKSPDKTSYLLGTSLELEGIEVEVTFDDFSKEIVNIGELIVSGYDSSTVGPVTVTVVYAGKTATFDVQIEPISVVSAEVQFKPAKTQYYIDDRFDPLGLSIIATYDSGLVEKLPSHLLEFEIAGTDYIPADEVGNKPAYHVFRTPGEHEVIVNAINNEAGDRTSVNDITRFTVDVLEAHIDSLIISKLPEKRIYFVGDELDLSGIVVYAKYDDDQVIRLIRDDFDVSGFNSSEPEENQTITITHKSITTSFHIVVKTKEIEGIGVKSYPKTTYDVGEEFDKTGLIIAKYYDDGDSEILPESDYEIDASSFIGTQTGIYDIVINPTDSSLGSITFAVSVVQLKEPDWEWIRFGQSTSAANGNNNIYPNQTVDKKTKSGTHTLEALGGSAGKITGDHDGISYYYTVLDAKEDNFILTADVTVYKYATSAADQGGNPAQSGQESFGLMARDAIGEPDNANDIFSSNIVAVGGFSGGTREPNGIQLFARTGVVDTDAEGSQGITKKMLRQQSIVEMDNATPGTSELSTLEKTYTLTLQKNNSGFFGQVDGAESDFLFLPDILDVMDEKLYVGFFVARDAVIEVDNIEFIISKAATDAPREEAPPVMVQPSFDILSLDKTPLIDYDLIVQANVNGTFILRQDSKMVNEKEAIAGQLTTIPVEKLNENATTSFGISFIPDDTQHLTSYEMLHFNLLVEHKTYGQDGGNIHVAPNGTSAGDGSEGYPVDIESAIDFVRAGQTILLADGVYPRTSKLEIKKYNDGEPNAKKKLFAAPGATPIIDFQKVSEGVLLSGDYWHVKGIAVTRSAGNYKGMVIGGSYNIVEDSSFYENGDTGLQISRTDFATTIAEWPSHNLILNSTSYNNADPSSNNADGFGAKLTVGEGNIFRGTIAYGNVDDGYDLYAKAGTGPIGAVIIEDSIAYNNGGEKGDGNGFKLGGEGIEVFHMIKDSIAFDNKATGFTSNSNPGVIATGNNVSFNNGGANADFRTYTRNTPNFTIDGFVSFRTEGTVKDVFEEEDKSNSNFFIEEHGLESKNKAGVILSVDNFKSLVPEDLPFKRDLSITDGSSNIVLGDFLKFIPPASEDDVTPPSQHQTQYDNQGNIVIVNVNESMLRANLAMIPTDAKGKKQVDINITSDSSVLGFNVNIPASVFTAFADEHVEFVLNSEQVKVGIPSDMFSNEQLEAGSEVTISVEKIDVELLSDEFIEAIGHRPIISINLLIDGQLVQWNNPDTAVNISIAYTPTAEELANDKFIVAWYINRDGHITPMTSSKYDVNTGTLNFSTNHFSRFVVLYDQKTFADLTRYGWAKHEIDVLATRGIINGMTAERFAPERHITRADLTLLLVRALGLSHSFDEQFTDVSQDDYYYNGVGVAKSLGLIEGRHDGLFYPREHITRQDMFVIAARALRQLEQMVGEADQTILANYTDQALISSYALTELAALIENELVQGNNNRLNPLGLATRAEAAVFIYRLFYLEE